MPDLTLVGAIMKERADNQSDESIAASLQKQGYASSQISMAMDAIDADDIFVIRSLAALTPVNPVIYRLGIKKIEVERRILWGLFKKTTEVAIKTIDRVSIEKNLISAKVTITHSGEDQVVIDAIARSDGDKARKMYADIIEAQRRNVINIAQD